MLVKYGALKLKHTHTNLRGATQKFREFDHKKSFLP